MDDPRWIHARLAEVAEHCVGVDVLSDGVAEMRRRGFDAVCQDLAAGAGELSAAGPFDVIVAGELIEHVEAIGMVFEAAHQLLTPAGQLILTTPNPYAPDRVRAAQLGIVWENVDHIFYAFPSGIAELADRHGLVLSEAAVVEPARPDIPTVLRAVRQRLRGKAWIRVGFASFGELKSRRASAGPMTGLLRRALRSRRLLGETFVYTVTRAGATNGLAPTGRGAAQ
jgi:SAM-dependent methyltransferase